MPDAFFRPPRRQRRMTLSRDLAAALLVGGAALSIVPTTASAFCGFYVGRADTKLYNKASQVAIVRDEDRTVLTMSNDFQGDAKEFAMVIPVPTKIERGQVNVADRALIEHLDAYSAPRLVEYFDDDPCERIRLMKMMRESELMMAAPSADDGARARSLGVTIEAQYDVGEYDILILNAKQSGGLITWLTENGYKMPDGAERVVGSYIKQGMRFFVAKVDLEAQAELGFTYLRPLQVAYEHKRFMLPIRLGTLNADGKQELFVYTLTRTGRVETTNYRTVRLPTGAEIPPYVKGKFGEFYKAMFERQVEREDGRAVFLEYAWDMNWCDPCAADPLSDKELSELGVFWLGAPANDSTRRSQPAAKDVFITRLHVRYDAETFPEDLMFHETGNRENFQGRYVLRHPYKGPRQCDEAKHYFNELPKRQSAEMKTLATLTGWDIDTIRADAGLSRGDTPVEGEPWWKRLWKQEG